MRPEDKDNADNQMGPRSIKSQSGTTGKTSGVGLTSEDKSGFQDGTGSSGARPDQAAWTNLDNSKSVPINKSRGTGVQINNGALTAGQANPAGTGPTPDDDGSGKGESGASEQAGMGGGSIASQMAKVTKVSGESIPGMNYGPSIGRFDNPPAVLTRTGTDEAIEDACDAVEDRWPGTDTEQTEAETRYSSKTGNDRIWR